MTLTDDVLLFSHDYINSRKERTFVRKRKIRTVYKELTGKNINGSCVTCYIEALLDIAKYFGKFNTEEMAHCRYALKAGVLLQAFGDTSKTCTNANLTDELAEWHLKNNPGVERYFSVLPGNAPTPVPGIQIIAPMTTPRVMEIVPPVKVIPTVEVIAPVEEIEKKKRQYPSRKNKS